MILSVCLSARSTIIMPPAASLSHLVERTFESGEGSDFTGAHTNSTHSQPGSNQTTTAIYSFTLLDVPVDVWPVGAGPGNATLTMVMYPNSFGVFCTDVRAAMKLTYYPTNHTR